MPRKTRRSLPAPAPRAMPAAHWIGYAVTALISSALGAAITLAIIHEKPRPAIAAPAHARASGDTAPPAELTAGLPPGQAASNLGNWRYDHQEWPQAIDQYMLAIASGIDNPDIRTDLGNAYRFSGQPQRALEQYRLAQKQNPRHENSLFNQGGVYSDDFHDPQRAVLIWREYLRRFPQGQHVDAARALIADARKSSGVNTGKE